MQENLLEKQFLNHPLYAKIQELKALLYSSYFIFLIIINGLLWSANQR